MSGLNRRPTSAVTDRFAGVDGRRALLEAVADQSVVGQGAIAEELVDVGKVEYYAAGDTLIEQGATDRSICLILVGEVTVKVDGRPVTSRIARQHVGEMALVDVRASRCATVVATSPVCVLRIEESDFTNVASRHPDLWRRIAIEGTERLRQRNALVEPKNEKPILFVGSSREGLEIARAVQSGLDHDPVNVRVWTDGVFGPSGIPLDDLLAQARGVDFAVLVVGRDDAIDSRGAVARGPRDNVVFELGLFMGRLGRERTFILSPRGVDLKIPTDLLGVKPIEYDPSRLSDIRACLGAPCTELRNQIIRLGSR